MEKIMNNSKIKNEEDILNKITKVVSLLTDYNSPFIFKFVPLEQVYNNMF